MVYKSGIDNERPYWSNEPLKGHYLEFATRTLAIHIFVTYNLYDAK